MRTTPQGAALSARLAQPFSNRGRDLVIQYQVKHEEKGKHCGGAYIKLFPSTVRQATLRGPDPRCVPDPDDPTNTSHFHDDCEGEDAFNLMFGPDVCGLDHKVHAIFHYGHEAKKLGGDEAGQLREALSKAEVRQRDAVEAERRRCDALLNAEVNNFDGMMSRLRESSYAVQAKLSSQLAWLQDALDENDNASDAFQTNIEITRLFAGIARGMEAVHAHTNPNPNP